MNKKWSNGGSNSSLACYYSGTPKNWNLALNKWNSNKRATKPSWMKYIEHQLDIASKLLEPWLPLRLVNVVMVHAYTGLPPIVEIIPDTKTSLLNKMLTYPIKC